MVTKKAVMKFSMLDAKKRSKALKTAVGMPGVTSAALEEDQITVVGDGFDAIELTKMLRKRVGHTQIVTVTTGDEDKEAKSEANSVQPIVWQYYHLNTVQPYNYVVREYDPYCNIM